MNLSAILLLGYCLCIIDASPKSRKRYAPSGKTSSDNQPLMFPSRRNACNFYVWNILSAGLHRLCHHLCKECKYEGAGGREFLLIPSGSLLQLIYPCNQYSPDACIWCGGKHADHVDLAWSKKHLYSPLDMTLDRVRKEAASIVENKVWKDVPADVTTIYGFHKRYVTDIDNLPNIPKRDRDGRPNFDPNAFSLIQTSGVRYLLPRLDSPRFSQLVVMFQLRRLIEIQQFENEISRLKVNGEYTRHRAKREKNRLLEMHETKTTK